MDFKLIIAIITLTIIVITIIVSYIVLRKKEIKGLKEKIEVLEKDKNTIVSTTILNELSKVEEFIKTQKLEEKFKKWQDKFEEVKQGKIPQINEMIFEADQYIEQKNIKNALKRIAEIEIEIYKTRAKTNHLLNQIREVTLSEEKNRGILTKHKNTYRKLKTIFEKNINDYKEYSIIIETQFSKIESLFLRFEKKIEKNNYEDVVEIVNDIEKLVTHLEIVIDEIPNIILLINNILPKKMQEIKEKHDAMIKGNYILDYLNIEYNILESSKKISAISDKAKMLNLEDSLFELKTISNYYDSLIKELEKEELCRDKYLKSKNILIEKTNKLNKVIEDIFVEFDNIKFSYNFSENEVNFFEEIKKRAINLTEDILLLFNNNKEKSFAYSKLLKELEILAVNQSLIEADLNNLLASISDMKDDEARAKQQLEEIKQILKNSKYKLREYKLPILNKEYYIQLSEAEEAIKEIIIELEKTPKSIETLNTRVDTARDLAFKLYNTTSNMVNNARVAESTITYGNRYRSTNREVATSLDEAEKLFNNGEYKKSIEVAINSLDSLEPGIYNKIISKTKES